MSEAVVPGGTPPSVRGGTTGGQLPGALPGPLGDRPALSTLTGLGLMAAILAIAVWTGNGGIALLAALIIAVAIVARGWNAVSLLGVSAESRLGRLRAFPGDEVELAITVANNKPLPVAMVRADQALSRSLLPLASNAEQAFVSIATPLRWFESATHRVTLHCRRRGYFPIGPMTLVSGDMFGLFESRSSARGKTTHLIVYPKLLAMEELGLASLNPLGDAHDPSRLFEDANRPDGIRDYTADTPFKNIAWAASARQGQLQAKTFETTATLRATLVLDVDSLAADEAVFEFAVSATASLAHHLIETRQPVGLAVNGSQADGGGAVALRAGRGEDQERAMLEALAKLRRRQSLGLSALLDRVAQELSGRTTVAVVAGAIDASSLARLAELRRKGHSVTLLIAGGGTLPDTHLPTRRLTPGGNA